MYFEVCRLTIAVSLAGVLMAADSATATKSSGGFEKTVQPVLAKTCAPCHNERITSGGLNLAPYSAPGSIAQHRDDWHKILQQIRTGEIPPNGAPLPPSAQIQPPLKFL